MARPVSAEALAPRAMVPTPWRVAHARREAPLVTTLELTPEAGEVPDCRPGQFNMLYAFGTGEIPISVSGDCGDRSRLVHTVREVGSVSAALARLEPGACIGVRGPFGSAWPVAGARGRDVVVVGGGLGIVPLKPVLHELARRRGDYRHIHIIYGTRQPEDILYAEELERWRSQSGFEVVVTVDIAEAGWSGEVGVVTPLIDRARFDPGNTSAFVCGPEVMMRIAAKRLVDGGVPAGDIHLSMERNMKCAIGLCGHCQWGADFVCRDGPVYDWSRAAPRVAIREL